MKKILPLILSVFLFICALSYLHQKVQIYVEAYRLSVNYQYYNELVDNRDYLMYNFSREVSLDRINQWVKLEDFSPVGPERTLVLAVQKPFGTKRNNKFVSLVDRFLRASTSTSTALAEEKE